MYAKARRGEIKDFTGIDDVYEIPETAEITIDTVNFTVEENARSILDFLAEKGFVQTGSIII
jgi:adenylylsulfate kinase-like enzyme